MAEQAFKKEDLPPAPRFTRYASTEELELIEEKSQIDNPLDSLGLMQSYSPNRPSALSHTPRDIVPCFPVVFDPAQFYADDSDSMIQYTNYVNIMTKGQVSLIWVLCGILSLLVLMYGDRDRMATYIATMFISMWALFLFGLVSNLLHTVWSGFALYKVISETSIPPKWMQMSIASKQYFWGNRSINTISELCHIEGSWTHKHLMTLSIYSWHKLILFFAVMALKNPCDFHFDFVDVMMAMGMANIMFIGICKVDYLNDVQSNVMHGIPAFFAVLFVPLGYMIQQYNLDQSMNGIWAIVTCWTVSGLFIYLMGKVVEEEKQYTKVKVNEAKRIINDINRMSLKQLLTEIMLIGEVIVIFGLWMMDYDQNCSYGCRGPVHAKCENLSSCTA